jgi:hypothetical protein
MMMAKKRMDSVLWMCIAALGCVPACSGSTPAAPTAAANTAALSNAMDDDSDGTVDENDEGMDEDEDGTVDEANEHHDMCMKRHHGGKSKGADHDGTTDESADETAKHAAAGGSMAQGGRGAKHASDSDDSADEAAKHAAAGGSMAQGGRGAKHASDADDSTDEAAKHAAAGSMAEGGRGARHAAAGGESMKPQGAEPGKKQGKKHPAIADISCSDVPDTTAATPDAG